MQNHIKAEPQRSIQFQVFLEYTKNIRKSKPMASKTKASSSRTSSYVEFEPHCEWQREGEVETLILHLPSFKKDQLKVQVNNQGTLKVSGERPLALNNDAKRSRFLKETKIPQGCNINEIRAKFMNNRLHITMPKKAPQVPLDAGPTSSVGQRTQDTQRTKAHHVAVPNDEELNGPTPSDKKGKMETMTGYDEPKDHMFGLGRAIARLQDGNKVTLSFGIAMVVIMAIGAYVA